LSLSYIITGLNKWKPLVSVILIFVMGILPVISCSTKGYSGEPVSITLGGLVSDANLMFFVAEDQHFFEENGITFIHKTYGTGVETITELMNDKIDIAGSAEYPFATKAFEINEISIIANIDKSYVIEFLGLTDRGIKNIKDIKGKRIGLPRGTLLEFYLGRFLDLNGMSIQDVSLINMSAGQEVDAIANGTVDGVVTRDPWESQIREQNENRLVSWSVQSGQAAYSILICRNDWIMQHTDIVERFNKSLAQAEEFITQRPDEAKAILKRRLGYSDDRVSRAWKQNQFSLSLDQSLIVALEDEARWTISNKLTKENQIPDFGNYIYVDGLKAVKPEAVNIR
jgi:ABC-type nitrate/sulfonate/bicarbonate transport system substrate-binding protein